MDLQDAAAPADVLEAAQHRAATTRREPRNARHRVAVLALAVLPLGIALPAGADTGGTTATVTVTPGSLTITVPTSAGTLASGVSSVNGSTISGSLGQVQVNDARGAAAGSGWVVTVISTAFTPPAGPTIGGAAVGYVAGSIAKVGTATYVANDPTAISGAMAAVTASGITGQNSATWNPTINIALLGSTAAANYTGTITHSVT